MLSPVLKAGLRGVLIGEGISSRSSGVTSSTRSPSSTSYVPWLLLRWRIIAMTATSTSSTPRTTATGMTHTGNDDDDDVAVLAAGGMGTALSADCKRKIRVACVSNKTSSNKMQYLCWL